jgi:putative nucleotidyltransferase with HDIG domain
VEAHDPYTAGHERRVGIIASDIAREMGWSEEKCHTLKFIGLVHDIGKMSIPAAILSKPGLLSAIEFELVKTHAEQGYQILKDVDFSLPIARIIREHHERMDGSGYPQGLKGEETLLEARILAVADVLEAMASHRPYRAALGIEAALKEIETHRVQQFDPEVVDAALRLFREKEYQLPA